MIVAAECAKSFLCWKLEGMLMTLTLYLHPLASFCHKVLIALYENDTPFEASLFDFSNTGTAASHMERWPLGKIPVLHDTISNKIVAETSIIIEYLQQHFAGPVQLIPDAAALQLDVRLWDRFIDLYVSVPMQKIVGTVSGQKEPLMLMALPKRIQC